MRISRMYNSLASTLSVVPVLAVFLDDMRCKSSMRLNKSSSIRVRERPLCFCCLAESA